jgi:predicted ATPase
MIKVLHVKNFKSFKDVKIELGKFNVVIGSNASGKSNFVEIFRFLKDIKNFGLDNALGKRGDPKYLINLKIGSSEPLYMRIETGIKLSDTIKLTISKKEIEIEIKIEEPIYEFALEFDKEGPKYKIINDRLIQKKGDKEIILEGNPTPQITQPEGISKKELLYYRSILVLHNIIQTIIMKKELLLRSLSFFPPISIYNFDPNLIKWPQKTGGAELEEDGRNLTFVLKNILENEEKRRIFFNLVEYLLSFIEDIKVEKSAEDVWLTKLKEKYLESEYLPSFFISDGTVNMIALIVALYFEKEEGLTIIEEPERNIHPALFSKIVEMMKEASQNKQIIITTHNPEIVKYADIQNLLLLSRDEEGFSVISRPEDKEEVKTFIKNEIGVDELFIKNLL